MTANYNFKKQILLFFLLIVHSFSFGQTPGTIDDTFYSAGFGVGNNVLTTIVLNDGKIIIGGAISSYNGVNKYGIIKLNADGSLDTSFDTGTGTFCDNDADVVFHCSAQSDGKLIVAGDFKKFNCVNRGRIVRLNANGSIDDSFNPTGVLSNDLILTTLIQNDGKIIIGGLFTSFDGVPATAIARLNTDGTLDTTFLTGTKLAFSIPSPRCSVVTMALQSDNKIIIGGNFNSYDGIARSGIARLNADGTLDETFDPGTGTSGTVTTCNVLGNGKIIIAGNFNSVNGIENSKIARLNSNGGVDESFISPPNFNGPILVTTIQNNGKIIIGGEFTLINGNVVNRISRLNPDGSIDGFFFSGLGANAAVRALPIQSNGKIFVGGDFTTYNNITKNKILRIHGDPIVFPLISIVGQNIGTPWETDINLSTTDGIIYSLSNYDLPSGELKFRQDNSWTINWGGATATGTFPSSTGVQDGYNIYVPSGTYTVQINKNTGAYFFNSNLSIDENTLNEVFIYPNPTDNIINISAQNQALNQINIYDMFGRLIKVEKATDNNARINIQELPNAVYLMEVKTDKGIKTEKIIKH